ncbi:hypothetical protein DV532_28150 (plasmid) [Pseudomonas sp. Leaf58]|uniref:hypothetical protein n=1 Tax=Pseudomonas sp. Leaf58 TaxID=1736226 RepID=UPI0006F40358|nr:hypothetical protein [Pseudomonas sp. Leaf58]AYG48142.1 hypothetical protein DV532_28150 [Pseudomonas sp. Leaf58]KQN62305.1 hypothetical protein ASF02_09070 [Pseudomonas sp. Leaf58]
MTTGRALDKTRPADFQAFRIAFFSSLENNFACFKRVENHPDSWSLRELHLNNPDACWTFLQRYSYFQDNSELDLMAALVADGFSYRDLVLLTEKSHCAYSYLWDEFYESSLGAMAVRLPFASKSGCFSSLQRLFKEVSTVAFNQDGATEEAKLTAFFKSMLLNSLHGKPTAIATHYNTWLPQEEMCNLLSCDGEMSESLAETAISTLVGKQYAFEPYRNYHPLDSDRALPNPTGFEALMQILIRSLVYDKAAIMHLTDVDENAKWRVLQVTARLLADHINADPMQADKLATQMVINALCIFEKAVPEPLRRHHLFGQQLEDRPYTRLEHLVYAGPLQAHRLEPLQSFNATASFPLLLSSLEQIDGPLQPSELLNSHLIQVPAIGEIAHLRRVRGIEDHIDAMPNPAFLNVRAKIPTVVQKKAHEKIMVRSALMLLDYSLPDMDATRLAAAGLHSYGFRPADVDEQRLIIRALCEKGQPSMDLLKVCNISQTVIREHLHQLGEEAMEHTLSQDLGL